MPSGQRNAEWRCEAKRGPWGGGGGGRFGNLGPSDRTTDSRMV